MHETTNPVLRSALARHLRKWYPESVSSSTIESEAPRLEEADNGGVPVAPISFEATKIDVSKVFSLEASKELKEQVEELKNGVFSELSNSSDVTRSI